MIFRKSKLRNALFCILILICVYFLVLGPVFQVEIAGRESVDLSQINNTDTGVVNIRNLGAWWGDADIAANADTVLPEGAQEVLSNSEYSLYFSESTAEIALLNKSNQALWRSNPQIDVNSPSAYSGRALSQIVLGFYDAMQNYTEMNSYKHCVSKDNMQYTVKDKQLIVSYTIADSEIEDTDIPIQIAAPRMEKLLEKMSSDDADSFKFNYVKRSINGSTSESFVEAMKKKYPAINEYDIYEIKDTNVRRITEVYELLQKIEYTQEDLAEDDKACKIERTIEEKIRFDLELVYSLSKDGLGVEIDLSKLKEPQSVSINTITVLEYFGAGNSGDDGYFMVCDGSGSLIKFNNGKIQEPVFEMLVYGNDSAFLEANAAQQNQKYSLPVYGIKNGKNAILVHQVEGESLSSVNARVSGQQDEYNCAYFKLISSQAQTVSISKGKTIAKYEEQPYRGKFKIQYTPISGGDNGYNEMANEYREYLLENGLLKKHTVKEKAPVQLSFLGSVPLQTSVMGISVTQEHSLTTQEQLSEIVSDFEKEGLKSLVVGYQGWLNNGVLQKQANRLEVSKALGGKKGFYKLVSDLNKRNIDFYPSISFLNVYEKGNGFSVSEDNIRKISRDLATGYFYNPVNQYRRNDMKPIYQLSSRLLDEVGTGFINSSEKIGLSAVVLEDLGSQLSSDFNEKQPINREQSKSYSTKLLEKLEKNKIRVAVSNPNLYALSFASAIMDMPTQDSTYRICDQTVPFYQMVVRGYVDCFTKPLNYSTDYETEFLQAIEYGVAPSYLLTYFNTSDLKNTSFNQYNKSWYKDWVKTVKSDYQQYAEVFDSLQGVAITGHRSIGNGVYETTYENGETVLVNYTQSSVVIQDIEIPARGFVSKGGQS